MHPPAQPPYTPHDIVAALPHGVAVVHRDGRLAQANPAFARLLGRTPRPGSPVCAALGLPPGDVTAALDACLRAEPPALSPLLVAPGTWVRVELSLLTPQHVVVTVVPCARPPPVRALGARPDSRATAAPVPPTRTGPAHAPPPVPRRLTASGGSPSPATLRARAPLLIIEDDPVTAMVVRSHVERLGIEVTQARSGRAGLARARQRHHRTVLLDCMLPDMDGRVVFEMLRSLPPDRRPQSILATSSLVVGELPGTMRDAPVDGILAKPIDMGTLHAALEPHLHRVLPTVPDASEPPLPVLDRAALAAVRESAPHQDAEARVLTQFLRDLDAGRAALIRSMGCADLHATARAAHRLRSAAAAVGAARVAQACQQLVGVGRDGSLSQAAPIVAQLVAESKAVEHAITARYV